MRSDPGVESPPLGCKNKSHVLFPVAGFKGSLPDPDRRFPNWNRMFEPSEKGPKAGILLLHGMSDSP